MTLLYDTKAGLFWTALRRSSTVAPSVLASVEFWLFFAIHLSIFFASHYNKEWIRSNAWILMLDWDSVKIVSGITTFFEVFYSNQCYARYLHLYNTTRGMINSVHDLCHYLRVFVGDKAKGYSRLSTRYVILAMILHFYEMKGRGTDADIVELSRLGLLRDVEMDALLATPARHRAKVALTWCSFVTTRGCHKAEAPAQVLRALVDLILGVHGSQQEIADTMSLPVPFQYFHLLSSMIIMNLMLWALAMGLHESYFSPIIYFFSSFIFIGMMELSSDLSDPFGNDEVDFPVDKWMKDCIDMVVELLETEFPGGHEMMALLAQQEPVLSLRMIADISMLDDGQEHGGAAQVEGLNSQNYGVSPYAMARDRHATALGTPRTVVRPGAIGGVKFADCSRTCF